MLNSYSSEHPSRSMPLYTNTYDRTSTHHRSYCEGITPRETQIDQNSWISREHKTSGSSDFYAEIVNGSNTSDSPFPLFNGNDNTSERYATIK